MVQNAGLVLKNGQGEGREKVKMVEIFLPFSQYFR